MKKLAVAVFLTLSGEVAWAVPINSPVPANAYLANFLGLDWAWAAPCPQPNTAGCGGAPQDIIDLTYQSTEGWRLPTATELLSAPLATAFIFAGANVPLGGQDPISFARFQATNAALNGAAACAAPYFGTVFSHCDWQDGLGQPSGPWAGMAGAYALAEQLVVRDAAEAVPEPTTIGMLGAALAGLALRRRRAS